jgi:hypothetical protein
VNTTSTRPTTLAIASTLPLPLQIALRRAKRDATARIAAVCVTAEARAGYVLDDDWWDYSYPCRRNSGSP